MLQPILFGFFAHLSLTSSQAIPYRYHGGRDVTLVESRYKRFQDAKARNALVDELFQICGKVALTQQQCTTSVGRPKDSESLGCDSLCCLSGKKVGNCGSEYGVLLDITKIASIFVGGGGGSAAAGAVKPEVAANCFCSDDPTDVRCGRDGSFMGIRCPVDNSACWRKCCREGKRDGKCGGFLKFKCKCD